MESLNKLFLQQTALLNNLLPLAIVVLAVVITWAFWGSRSGRGKLQAPQAPGAWPIVGHLPLLLSGELLHNSLGALADKLGPVFMIRVGVHRSVVVSTWEAAKECYTTNDKIFASRPTSTAAEIIGYNYVSFGFAPYGTFWRQMRKVIMSELLSKSRIDSLKRVKDTEIDTSMKELYQMCVCNNNEARAPVLLEMKNWFGETALNVMLMMIVGKSYSSEGSDLKAFRRSMRSFMVMMGAFVIGEPFPFLKWWDLGGHKKEMKKTIEELDSLFQVWYEEHQKKRSASANKEEQDFMDVLISICQREKISEFDDATLIKATCLSLFAGSDTSMLTLTWMLALMLGNKEVLKNVRDELDEHVGTDRNVNESDIKNLVYLQAVVKEALRLYPAGPLGAPRVALEDCTLAGYHVPAGTRLVVNLSKIQRDPLVWPNPSEFRPERFLTTHIDMDVRGQHYELTPFGSGRRTCPGMSLALQLLPLILARLVHGFDITNQVDAPIDMSESAGLTNLKATPLPVFITPRLAAQLY